MIYEKIIVFLGGVLELWRWCFATARPLIASLLYATASQGFLWVLATM